MESHKVASAIKVTKSRVDSLRVLAAGQQFLRDTELKGFAVRITATGAKSFVLEKRLEFCQ